MSNIGCNCVSARKNCRHGTLTGKWHDASPFYNNNHRFTPVDNSTPWIKPRIFISRRNVVHHPLSILPPFPRPMLTRFQIYPPMYNAMHLHQSEYTRARKLKLGGQRREMKPINPLRRLTFPWIDEIERGGETEEIKGSLGNFRGINSFHGAANFAWRNLFES